MKKSFSILLMLSALLFSGCGYNSLQEQEEGVFKAFSDIDTQLQRRSDLIPNLVSTVKGYADFEKSTLVGVVEARAKATSTTLKVGDLSNPAMVSKFNKAQSGLGSALSKLMVVVEKYPDLKANQQFQDLMHQLEGTENRIGVARTRYNDAVKIFNSSIRKFPASLTNNLLLNLERKEYFKAEEGVKEVPKVEF